MKKVLLIFGLLFLLINFLYSETETENDNSSTQDSVKIINNTPDLNNNRNKTIVVNSGVKADFFRKYNNNEFIDYFFYKLFGTGFSWIDNAIGNHSDWKMFAFSNYPMLSYGITNSSLWDGKISFELAVDGFIKYDQIDSYIKESTKILEEKLQGYYIKPRLGFKINPLDFLYIGLSYEPSFNIFADGNDEIEDFTKKPFFYLDNIITINCFFDKLAENEGIKVGLTGKFYITDKDRSWGFDKDNVIKQFRFTLISKNIFRIPLKALNKTFFEFNVEGYYSYYQQLQYGETKLNLNSYDPDRLWMNGYNYNDINYYKALKGRFLSSINFLSIKYIPEIKPYNPDNLILGMSFLFSYDVMFFSNNSKPEEIYINDNIINGFGLGYRLDINSFYKNRSEKLMFDINLNYGFDILNYEKNRGRFQLVFDFLWLTNF